MLIQGFLRMFASLFVGSVGAIIAGMTVGALFGMAPKRRSFLSSPRSSAAAWRKACCRTDFDLRRGAIIIVLATFLMKIFY